MEENQENLNISEKAEALARGYFREGLNCAECVLLAYMETRATSLPREILALSTGFGMGIGETRNMCGAISGAIMALGIEKGRQNPFEKETPKERIQELKEAYPYFATIVEDIKKRYGSLICSEISAPHGEFDGRERKKNCQEIIGYCAALAAQER